MTDLADIPINAAARRALEEAGIPSLEALATRRREEIEALRGVGVAALAVLDKELAARGLAFGTPVAAKVTSSSTTVNGAGAGPSASTAGSAQPSISGTSETVKPGPGYNPLAVIGLILAFGLPPAGVVLGHVALNQIKKSGGKGRELGITALAIGYTLTVLGLIALVLWLTIAIAVISTVLTAISQIPGAVGPGNVPMPGR